MADAGRCGGYAPISWYAVLGDGRTAALVARDGAIDWFPGSAFDAPPAFAALLDPVHGGRAELEPAVDYTVERRYRPGTAVLETTFVTAGARVTVTDCLNRQDDHPLPWTELARVVRAEGGTVPMRWRVGPGRRFGSAEPWAHTHGVTPLIETGDESFAVLTSNAGRPVVAPHEVAGEFTAEPGATSLLALIATDDEPLMIPPAAEVIRRVDATAGDWQAWQRRIRYDGPYADAVIRSALTLRLLTAVNGASVAAPTTSLPEAIGDDQNYDYRFTWVRDASFALDALTSLGLTEQVHATLSWLLRAVRKTAPQIHPFYTLGGEPAPPGEREITGAPGYRDSGPVREGNAAATQRQLGSYGHLMDAAYHYVRHGGLLGTPVGSLLARMADKVCDSWREPDAGIWELGNYQHYTSSKLGCWLALQRAAWFAQHDHLPRSHAGRWRDTAAEIHAWVDERCWSPRKNSYTMHPGTDDLDAAALLMARTGFCRGDDPRLHSTINAIRSELAASGPLLYRYRAMRGKEGAFAACTFWLVEALAHTGQAEQAHAVFEAMLAHCNDVGLLAEEIDPATGGFLGNFPQGLSHLALIGAAHALAPAGRDHGQPGVTAVEN